MLSDTQRGDFERDGYLRVENLLDAATLADIRADYAARLAALCRGWIEAGALPPSLARAPFETQLVAVNEAGLEWFQPLDISLPIDAFGPDVPMHASPSVFALLRHPRVLDLVEDLIGPEITSNPIQHVRIKPPLGRTRPGESRSHIVGTDWHQDRAVAMEEADATRMVTVWIAIGEATEENGCLQVIPGSHRGAMRDHCPARQLGIPTHAIETEAARPLPVGAGGAIVFHPLTVHGSLENRGEGIRWSFDVRYNVTGEPTGRSPFPAFVARSRRDPGSELHDARAWAESWYRTRARLAGADGAARYHRWDGSHAVCA